MSKPRAVSWRGAIVLLATLAAAMSTARLGMWQLDRAAQKTALHDAQMARGALPALDLAQLAKDEPMVAGQLHRRVALEGRWLDARSVYLENRQMNGQTGFFVVTPLLLASDDAVLVQRGWLPRDPIDRTQIAKVPTPTGPVRVEGHVAAGIARLFEFDAAASGAIRQNLDVAAFARESGLRLRPLVVVQTHSAAVSGDGLRRQWMPAALDVSKHHGYALQWFSLSALITGLYVWFQIIRPRRRQPR
jgi:surfeit locus 1 family protein